MRFEIRLTYLVMTHIISWLAFCLDIVFPSVCLQTPSAWLATVVTPSTQLIDSKVQTMVRLNVDPKEDNFLRIRHSFEKYLELMNHSYTKLCK